MNRGHLDGKFIRRWRPSQANDLGYAVTVVQDAHSTFDADLPAQEIIDQYNRQLAEIARVVPARSIDFSET
jgi:nicotinamidase-related amidase